MQMLDDPANLALLCGAALIAGGLNAVAGGGSFLTLPALVFTGVPTVTANATGTIALLPGYASAALGFRQDLKAPPGLSLRALTFISLLGGAIGAVLLVVTDDRIFRNLVPWLLLFATLLFAIGPALVRSAEGGRADNASPSGARASMMAISIYGGYFNGGLGILLLALFSLLGQTNLNAMNGAKNIVSVLLTSIAAVVYAWGGVVAWPQAFVMMIAATIGGYFGARIARHIPVPVLRAGIVATGLIMTVLFFLLDRNE